MNILIIGSGGREHSIGLALTRTSDDATLFFAPGNAGTATLGNNVDIKDTDLNGLLEFAKDNHIALTVVGPEAPLVLGVVDLFNENGLAIIGPSQKGALLEGSKQWAKDLMKKYDMPTAAYEGFSDSESAKAYIENNGQFPIVIKADGLAAGKGVTIAHSKEEAFNAIEDCLDNNKFAEAGKQIIIEDFLEGQEASVFAFTDGNTVIAMEPAQDHKAIFDGDKGPNTGGMGAYCPSPIVDDVCKEKINQRVFTPLLNAFKEENIDYKGIIFAGLMISKSGDPYIVEFNVRFGDPETQVVLPRLNTPLLDIFMAMTTGHLSEMKLEWSKDSCVCVVLASGGYPGSYEKGKVISGIENADKDKAIQVVHAGTQEKENTIVTSGGRVLGVVGRDSSLQAAVDKTYQAVEQIQFDGKYNRTDIAAKAL